MSREDSEKAFFGGLDQLPRMLSWYEESADTYEDILKSYGYSGPDLLLKHFDKFGIKEGGTVLDFLCGSGWIGRNLAVRGFKDVHGADGSEKMLQKARDTNCYKSLKFIVYTKDSKLPYDDRTFDAILLSGAFEPGHLPLDVMYELARVTKFGGKIAFILRDPTDYAELDEQFKDAGFEKLIEKMISLRLIKWVPGFPAEEIYVQDKKGYVWAFEVLDPPN